MSEDIENKPCQATPESELYRQLIDPNISKTELEWFAKRRIEMLKRYERFYMHIQAHLPEGLVVVCKICGKSLEEIEQALTTEDAKLKKQADEPSQSEITGYVSAADGDVSEKDAREILVRLHAKQAAPPTEEFTKLLREAVSTLIGIYVPGAVKDDPQHIFVREVCAGAREACGRLDAQAEIIECLTLSFKIEKNEASITKKIVERVAEKLNVHNGRYTGEVEKALDAQQQEIEKLQSRVRIQSNRMKEQHEYIEAQRKAIDRLTTENKAQAEQIEKLTAENKGLRLEEIK